MKVILTEYVYKHGVAGDVVDVADGFARNFLLPRGLGIKASPGALRRNQQLIKQSTQNRERLRSMESEAAAKIDGVELVFGVKAGKNGTLYGSVTTRNIAESLLEKTGVDINRRRISERQLRELGRHEVPVRISHEVNPVLDIVILREEEVIPYLNGEQVETLMETTESSALPEPIESAPGETFVADQAESDGEAAQASVEADDVEADDVVDADDMEAADAEDE